MVHKCGNISIAPPTGDDIMQPTVAMRLVSCSAPSRVKAGEDFTVDFTIRYEGDYFSATYDFGASAGSSRSEKTSLLTFTQGDERSYTVTITAPYSPGSYDINVYPYIGFIDSRPDDSSAVLCSLLEVEGSFNTSDVYVSNCSLSKTTVVGDRTDSVTSTATVTNDNPVPADASLNFSYSGFSRTVGVQVPANSTQSVSTDLTFSSPGQETIEVAVASASPSS